MTALAATARSRAGGSAPADACPTDGDRRGASRLLGVALLLAGSVGPAGAVELEGKFGFIGDWELTASLEETKTSALGGRTHRGAFVLRHVAACMPGEVSEKTGTISLDRVSPGARVSARLTLDGAECRYTGALREDRHGFVACPGKPAIPLTLWVKEGSLSVAAHPRTP